MLKKFASGATGLALMALAGTAEAALITDAGSLENTTVVDFSQFSGNFSFTPGPVEIGGLVGESITWQASNDRAVIGNGAYGLGTNGQWNGGRSGFTGLNSPSGSMDFLLETAVFAIGGFVNYIAQIASVVEIMALDSNGDALESYDLMVAAPVTPLGDNDGAFRGIQRDTADIYGFRVTNAYIVLDDLTFSREVSEFPIAEPASFALLGIGLAGLGLARRRHAV